MLSTAICKLWLRTAYRSSPYHHYLIRLRRECAVLAQSLQISRRNHICQTLLCGNYDVYNAGDEAILRGLENIIKSVNPACGIKVMGKGNLLPIGVRSLLKSVFLWKLWRKPVGLIKHCDVFILGGGGLFTDEEGFFVSGFWALHGLFALWMKKPVLIIGISVGKVRIWNRWLMKKLFARAKAVTVRDEFSQKVLEKYGVKSELGSDLALEFKPEKTSTLTDTKKYAVVSIRKYKNSGRNLHKKIAQLCDAVIAKYGLNIIFIPFDTASDGDKAVMTKIFDHMNGKSNAKILHYFYDLNELLKLFSQAEFVLATRLHAGIFSLITNTPFIPVAYMGKVDSFWGNNIKPTRKFDIDEILAEISRIYKQHSKRKEHLKHIFKTLVNRNRINYQVIQRFWEK